MKTLLTIALAVFSLTVIVAQPQNKSVVIGSMTDRPNALLIVNPPDGNQGVLLPQLSTGQRMSMKPSSPSENGLIVFDHNKKSYFYWADGQWVRLKGEGTAETSFYSIDPASFHELKADQSIQHNNLVIFQTDNTFVTASSSGLGQEIIAPVDLPHGAVLDEVTVFYMDHGDDNLKVYLIRKSLAGGNEQLINWESSGSSSSVRSQMFDSFRSMEKIDLENYTYRLVVIFNLDEGEEVDAPWEAKQRLYGVRIKYRK